MSRRVDLSEHPLSTGVVLGEVALRRRLPEGVEYYELKYSNREGKNVNAFAVAVKGDSPAEFRVWSGDLSSIDDGKESFVRKTVATQAAELEAAVGEVVLAATNGAYFRMSNKSNYPYSTRIVGGRVLWPPMIVTDTPARPDDWVGVTYDGRLVCGDKASYDAEWDGKLEYALAMGVHMMLDGQVNFSKGVVGCNPLTAFATTADGGFIMLCADGRSENSAGASGVDMLCMMFDIDELAVCGGLVNVYTLDGGGSTEMVLKDADKNEFITANYPSGGPGGISRAVGDIVAVSIKTN